MNQAQQSSKETQGQNSNSGSRSGAFSKEGAAKGFQAWEDSVKDAATDNVRRLKDKATEMAGKVRDQVSSISDSVSTSVKENPTNTVLISFGVGCLLGAGITYLLAGQSKSTFKEV